MSEEAKKNDSAEEDGGVETKRNKSAFRIDFMYKTEFRASALNIYLTMQVYSS